MNGPEEFFEAFVAFVGSFFVIFFTSTFAAGASFSFSGKARGFFFFTFVLLLKVLFFVFFPPLGSFRCDQRRLNQRLSDRRRFN